MCVFIENAKIRNPGEILFRINPVKVDYFFLPISSYRHVFCLPYFPGFRIKPGMTNLMSAITPWSYRRFACLEPALSPSGPVLEILNKTKMNPLKSTSYLQKRLISDYLGHQCYTDYVWIFDAQSADKIVGEQALEQTLEPLTP